MRALLISAAAAALAFAGAAQAETIAIVGAKVETLGPKEAIENGTVVIVDGKITAVGAGLAAPAGARVIDGKGKVVTPGLIAASTNLTASEVEGLRETRDDSPGANSGLSAGFDVSYGVNPDSTFIAVARAGGVTRAVVTPAPSRFGGGSEDEELGFGQEFTAGGGDIAHKDLGVFGGQAAAVRLADGDTHPVFARRIAVTADLGRGGPASSRGALFVLLRSALHEARQYARNKGEHDRGAEIPSRYTREDLEALLPVAEGRTPLLVDVARAADIRQVLAFAAEEHIRIVLVGAEEGWRVAPEIAAAHVPVIVDPQADLPSSFDSLGSRLDNVVRLHAAGVLVAIQGSRDFNNLRQQRLNAGTAVANGLPYEAALAAITVNPATIWGFADRAGQIAPGKDADLVIWTGDPLETSSWPVAVFVGGREQSLVSRKTLLRDRYLAQDSAPAR